MKRATAGSTIMIIGSFTLGQNMIFLSKNSNELLDY